MKAYRKTTSGFQIDGLHEITGEKERDVSPSTNLFGATMETQNGSSGKNMGRGRMD